MDWKCKEEDKHNANFVKQTGSKTDVKNNKISYFHCNRSGFFKSKTSGQRQLKSQGTDKIDGYCTAYIKVITRQHTGEVEASICNTHYGHEQDLGHIRLSINARLSIAGQLYHGVSQEHILDSIRDNVGDELRWIHLLTRKDLTNIEQSYHINTVQRHRDDAISVTCWVEEMKRRGQDNNPVLLYKPQTVPQPDHCDNLCDNDFIICLQTPIQASIMKHFGHRRIVCIDSTHGTNSYNFSLITVLVTDEFGEGYPVAWCLSNREDQFVLQQFFTVVKKRVGSIKPKFFMSDDADQFYNAWRSVFGDADNKLLCTWHVDRAWRDKLRLIKHRQTQATVYHNLRLLLEETNTQTFELLLTKTTQQLLTNAVTSEFGQYFQRHYENRKKQWAYCYRQTSTINTNMYVEAFHHVLKYIYLKGKVNKRVDNCIHTLLKVSRDKSFDRLTKLTKGKVTKMTTETNKRHMDSLEMDLDLVTQTKDEAWEVLSLERKTTYRVTVEKKDCHVHCALMCHKCNICIHTY